MPSDRAKVSYKFLTFLSTYALLFVVLAGYGQAQTQHGAAPEDQAQVLPPIRPDLSGASSVGTEPDLFPTVVESAVTLRVATGPVRGGYYAVGGVLCDLINAQTARHRIECLVRPTSGSGENLAHVLGGSAELGLVQSDWQSFAVTSAQDASTFALDFERLRSVAALYPLATQIVVRDAIGASSLADLRGRRIGLAQPGTGQRQLADVVLAQAGFGPRDMSITDFDADIDMVRALCASNLDAIILVGPAPMQPVDAALSRCDAQLLSVDPALMEVILGDREALASLSLGSNVYSGQRTPVQTLGYVVTLVASANLDERLTAEVARHLITDVESYAAGHPALSSVTGTSFFTRGLTAPLHDGVARYLNDLAQNLQIISDDLDGGDTLSNQNGE